MKKATKLGIAGLAAGVGAAGSFAALGALLYDRVMLPAPRDSGADENDPELYVEGRRWAERAEGFQEAHIQSMEGLDLWGTYVLSEQETSRWVICMHGFSDDHTSMGVFGKHFYEAGWNVLLPDQRGCGHSDGSYIGWGYDERLDLVGWIAWVLRRDPEAEILLHGVSMGAATVLMATGGALPKNVKAAVSDCAYSTIEEEMRHVVASHAGKEALSGVPAGVAFRALRRATLHRAGYDLRRVSPLESVSRSKTPTLFIHGTDDDFVPAYMLGKLFRAARCPKRYLWIPHAGHAVEAAIDPELYWSSVQSFLDDYMPEQN